MKANEQQLLWTVTNDPDEQCKTVKIARSDIRVTLKKIHYTPEQIAAFAQKIKDVCYNVKWYSYDEDENLGIKYNKNTDITQETIPLTDWVVQGDAVVGFLPSAYPYQILLLAQPDKTIWFLGAHSNAKGYTYSNTECTYQLAKCAVNDK